VKGKVCVIAHEECRRGDLLPSGGHEPVGGVWHTTFYKVFVVLFTVCVCVSLYERSDSAIELNDVVVVVVVGLVVVGEVWFVCLSVCPTKNPAL